MSFSATLSPPSTEAQAAGTTHPRSATIAIVATGRIGYADAAATEAELGQDRGPPVQSCPRQPRCLSGFVQRSFRIEFRQIHSTPHCSTLTSHCSAGCCEDKSYPGAKKPELIGPP